MNIKANQRLLFIGDSITDCARRSHHAFDLGQGFVGMIAGYLGATYPDKPLEIINRGIAGNVMADMIERWQEDCLDLKPDMVTILIGVNDIWRRMDQNLEPSQAVYDQFESHYRYLIQSLKEQNPEVQIILMDTFVIPNQNIDQWKTYQADINAIIHRIANDFALTCVSLGSIMAKVCSKNSSDYFIQPDGVHPHPAGHGIIAKAWIENV